MMNPQVARSLNTLPALCGIAAVTVPWSRLKMGTVVLAMTWRRRRRMEIGVRSRLSRRQVTAGVKDALLA